MFVEIFFCNFQMRSQHMRRIRNMSQQMVKFRVKNFSQCLNYAKNREKEKKTIFNSVCFHQHLQ